MSSILLNIPNLINFFAISMGIGVSLLCILQVTQSPLRREVKGYFRVYFWSIITYLVMHLTREMLNGIAGETVRFFLYATTFLEFLVSGFMVYLLSLLILVIAAPEKNAKTIGILFLAMVGIHVTLLFVSQFFGWYYSFDEANQYHRGAWYLMSNLAPFLMMVQDIYLLIRFRAKFVRRVAIAFWIYILLPLAAMILQALIPTTPQIQFVIAATVLGAVNMFSVITNELTQRFVKQQMEASRLDTELSMATRIQADMLPSIFPAFPERKEFDLFASMKPAKEVGGDFYDFFLIDDGHLGIVIADVSGKGVPAALFMMVSKILVQNYAMMNRDPKSALEATNNQICQNNNEEMFVTVWLGILDLKTGVLTAANAGHEYPALKLPGKEFDLVKDKHGFVIGGMAGVKYKPYELRLEPGARLFLYTDGVPEATNAKSEQFGTDRMIRALRSRQDGAPREILESVENAIGEFVKDASQFDDITMLCLQYNGPDA